MRKKKFSLWGMLAVGIVGLSVVITLINRGNPLPGHGGDAGGSASSPAASDPASVPQIHIVLYENENPSFTIMVPEEWTKIVKGGYATWIDRASASSFQIQIGAYTPDITQVTRDTVGQEIASFGGELVQFYWMDEFNYACLYRTFTDVGSVANIEITAFNQKNIIRFVFMVNEAHYTGLENTIAQMIDSFVWDRFN